MNLTPFRIRTRTTMAVVLLAALVFAGIEARNRWARLRKLAAVEDSARRQCSARADLFRDRIHSDSEWPDFKPPFLAVPERSKIPLLQREVAYWTDRAAEHVRMKREYESRW